MVERHPAEAIAARLQGGRHAPEYGGQGWSMLEWFLVNEQFGRTTNGLHWHVPNAYNVLTQATPEQVDRYLRPILRGEGGDTAYAVTEARVRLRPEPHRHHGRALRRRLGDRTARSGSSPPATWPTC